MQSVAYSPDGTTLVAASKDGMARLVTALVVTPDRTGLVSAAADGSLRWWDTALADLSGTVWKHPADVYGVDYSRDGTRLRQPHGAVS